jgi:hypothetical protein
MEEDEGKKINLKIINRDDDREDLTGRREKKIIAKLGKLLAFDSIYNFHINFQSLTFHNNTTRREQGKFTATLCIYCSLTG